MIATVLATYSNEKSVTVIRTFENIDEAEKRVKNLQKSTQAMHCQIVVDYSTAQFYKEKYEELFDMFVRNARPDTTAIGKIS